MKVFSLPDPAMPDAAAHALMLPSSLVFLSQFEFEF